jgi:hypothetical protein
MRQLTRWPNVATATSKSCTVPNRTCIQRSRLALLCRIQTLWEITGYVHNAVLSRGAVAVPDWTVKFSWAVADTVMCVARLISPI